MTAQNRAIVILFLGAAAIAIGVASWYLFDFSTEPTVIDDAAGDGREGSAARALTGQDRKYADGEASVAALGEEESSERVPLVTEAGSGSLAGRLILSDGSPPPRPVGLTLSKKRPPFSFLTIRELGRSAALCLHEQKQLDEARVRAWIVSDASGAFRFEGLAPGAYRVVPLDPFLHIVRSKELIVTENDESAGPFDVALRLGGSLEGIVRDSAGKLLPGIAVTLRERFDVLFAFSPQKGMRAHFTTETDGKGRFRFDGVPGDTSFFLDLSGRDRARVVGHAVALTDGVRRSVEITMPDAAAISGIVQDEAGAPAPGRKIRLVKSNDILGSVTSVDKPNEETILSEEDGAFRFGNLMAGTYRVMINEKGLVRTGHRKIELAAGEEREGLVLVLEQGLTLEGRVLSSDGKPVEGARVKAKPEFDLSNLIETIDDASFLSASATDEEGRFRCAGLAAGTYDLEIERNGFTDTTHKGFEAGKTDLVITLEWGGIAGIAVSTIDGEPVTRYRITLEPQGFKSLLDPFGLKSKIERRISDEQGKFEIAPLLPASYTMTVKAKGFGRHRTANIAVEDGKTRRGILIMLAEEASVSGTVYDAATEEPIEGARISLKTGIEGMIAEFAGADAALSDEFGRYTFGGLSEGPVRLFVSHGQYETRPLDELRLAEGEKIEGLDVSLTKGAIVRGHVLGPDRSPIEGANIMASSPTGTSIRATRSDKEGFYELSGFAPGSYNVMRMSMKIDMDEDFLQSMMSGIDVRPVKLEKDEILEIDFVVGADGREGGVFGRVTEAGRPVPKAIVSLLPVGESEGTMPTITATTDAEGRYSFRRVDPGDYTFRVVRTENLVSGGGTEAVSRTTIPEGDTFEYDIQLPGGTIEGTVLSDSFRPLPSIRILVRRSEGEGSDDPIARAMAGRVGEVYTDREGRFRIGNLRAGSYDLVAGGSNMIGIDSGGYARTTVDGIAVRKDQAVRGVEIRLEKGGSIEGVLIGTGGVPAAGASIFFQPERERKFGTFSECYSDGGGKFRYSGLAAGRYTLAIKHPSHALTLVYDVVVRKDATRTVNRTLTRGTELLVSIVDGATGKPVGAAQVDLLDGAGNRLNGLLGLDDVMNLFYASGGAPEGPRSIGRYAPGTYHLRISHAEHGSKELDLQISGGDRSMIVPVTF